MINIAVFVSGGGTNLQALIDSESRGENPCGKIKLVVSSSEGAYALKRAEDAHIKTATIKRSAFSTQEEYDRELLDVLEKNDISLIVLAGFMTIVSTNLIEHFDHRILNIHPSLIPSFSGKGFYGLKVHEEALKRGVKISGATVHYVNEICDGGEIIAQKAVEVLDGDTPEVLQKRIMEQAEWKILPKAVADICQSID